MDEHSLAGTGNRVLAIADRQERNRSSLLVAYRQRKRPQALLDLGKLHGCGPANRKGDWSAARPMTSRILRLLPLKARCLYVVQTEFARLSPMPREISFRRCLLALFCVLLLGVRAEGAHLHLCFDGSEPPVSFHAFDVGLHHDEPEASTPHQDADVDVAGEIVARLLTPDLDFPPVLLAALIGLFLLPPQRLPARLPRPSGAVAAASFLRPPLRGPPALSSL